jgi:hypothetical protein
MAQLQHLIKKSTPCPSTTCATVEHKTPKPVINVENITGERLLKVEETAVIIGAAVGTLNRARVCTAMQMPRKPVLKIWVLCFNENFKFRY